MKIKRGIRVLDLMTTWMSASILCAIRNEHVVEKVRVVSYFKP